MGGGARMYISEYIRHFKENRSWIMYFGLETPMFTYPKTRPCRVPLLEKENLGAVYFCKQCMIGIILLRCVYPFVFIVNKLSNLIFTTDTNYT